MDTIMELNKFQLDELARNFSESGKSFSEWIRDGAYIGDDEDFVPTNVLLEYGDHIQWLAGNQ